MADIPWPGGRYVDNSDSSVEPADQIKENTS